MWRERVRRVMRLYGVKPYRRHGRKYRKRKAKRIYPNLLLEVMPSYANHVWVTDITELPFHGKKVYVCTILDLPRIRRPRKPPLRNLNRNSLAAPVIRRDYTQKIGFFQAVTWAA